MKNAAMKFVVTFLFSIMGLTNLFADEVATPKVNTDSFYGVKFGEAPEDMDDWERKTIQRGDLVGWCRTGLAIGSNKFLDYDLTYAIFATPKTGKAFAVELNTVFGGDDGNDPLSSAIELVKKTRAVIEQKYGLSSVLSPVAKVGMDKNYRKYPALVSYLTNDRLLSLTIKIEVAPAAVWVKFKATHKYFQGVAFDESKDKSFEVKAAVDVL